MTSLEQRIRIAFAGNRYPGDDRLTVYGPVESEETFSLLKGKTWQEMPAVQFMRGDTPIPDLTSEAFHYYMPALLLAALGEFPDLGDTLSFYFAPSSCELLPGDARDDFCKRVQQHLSLFNVEQHQVIADVLRECVNGSGRTIAMFTRKVRRKLGGNFTPHE